MKKQMQEEVTEVVDVIVELKKQVNRKADWEARLVAVNELAKLKTDEAMNILQFVAKSEPVTTVRETAVKAIKKSGGTAPSYEAPKYGLFKDLRKVFLRIKKSLPKDHSYEDFKVKLEKMRSDIFNTYQGEEGKNFDAWLKDMWETTKTQR